MNGMLPVLMVLLGTCIALAVTDCALQAVPSTSSVAEYHRTAVPYDDPDRRHGSWR